MPLKTSYFNKGVYFSNLKRFWLIGFAFALLLSLIIFSFINSLNYRSYDGTAMDVSAKMAKEVFPALGLVMMLFLSFFSLISALAVFSYMHLPKNTAMIHALPIKREGLFITNYLSGLTLVFLPVILGGCILMIGYLAVGVTHLEAVLLWVLVSLVLGLLLYSFAVFAGMFTGHIAAQAIFYLIFNLLVAFLDMVTVDVLANFLLGYSRPRYSQFSPFSPLLYIEGLYYSFHTENSQYGVLIGYFLAALLFTAGALLIYRKRRMEVAGDVVSLKVMRPVFKYSVAICSSALFGSILIEVLNMGRGLSAYIICSLLGGFIGYFAAEMLLKKTFKVFKRWKGFVAYALILTCLFIGLELDPMGYETYIPAAEEVDMLYVGNNYTHLVSIALSPERYNPYEHRYILGYGDDYPRSLDEGTIKSLRKSACIIENPQVIQKALNLHRYIITHQAEIKDPTSFISPESANPDAFNTTGLVFMYRLTSGRIVERSYSIPYSRQYETAVEELMRELFSAEEFRVGSNPELSLEADDISLLTLDKPNRDGFYTSIDLTSYTDEILKAYRQDILEQDPLNTLLYMKEVGYTGIGLNLTLRDPVSINKYLGGMTAITQRVESISLMTDHTHTIDLLARLGFLTEEDLVVIRANTP